MVADSIVRTFLCRYRVRILEGAHFVRKDGDGPWEQRDWHIDSRGTKRTDPNAELVVIDEWLSCQSPLSLLQLGVALGEVGEYERIKRNREQQRRGDAIRRGKARAKRARAAAAGKLRGGGAE